MTLGELAAFVCSHLKKKGMEVVLSGGGCVSIYTTNRYQSYDLDFIQPVTNRKKVRDALSELGFKEENRYFKHPESEFWVEFPPGPLAVGDEPVKEVVQREFATGQLYLISPTDCVKDRLAGFYHWEDRQCLEQAVLVAQNNKVDLDEIARWSQHEKKEREFARVLPRFQQAQAGKRIS
ncbi:MAG: hypothetical protein GKR89_01995 [Candidatus Latescibacteria bacterium]|nr:hypothetical protein [Candidatus Latescibacterota bacterium]